MLLPLHDDIILEPAIVTEIGIYDGIRVNTMLARMWQYSLEREREIVPP